MTPVILTDELRRENQSVTTILGILERICEKIDSGEQVPERDLDEIVELAETLVQRVHQSKEEELLLSTMEESPVREHGALAALLEDHRAIRKHFDEMRAALARYRGGDATARLSFAGSARLYSRPLDEHLEIAQRDLYERVDIHLSRKKRDELMERFMGFEGICADAEERVLRLRQAYV